MYDEIEAEVNLVFDQLMYLLSHEVYTYSKNVASMVILDGTDFTKTMGAGKTTVVGPLLANTRRGT